MNKVTDRVVQYAHRYRLVNVETGEILGTFDLEQITGTIAVEGTKLNAELFNKMKTSIADVDLQEIFMMDNTYAFELDKPTVARAYADSDGNPINRTYLKTSGGVMSSGIQIKNNTTAPTGISYSVQDNIPMLVNTTLSASNQKLKFMGTQGGMLTFTMPSKAGTLALTSDIPTVSNKYLHNIILKGSSFTICIQTLTNSSTKFSSVSEIQNYLNNYFERGYIICTGYFTVHTVLYATSNQSILTLYCTDGETYTVNYSDVTTFSDTIPL